MLSALLRRGSDALRRAARVRTVFDWRNVDTLRRDAVQDKTGIDTYGDLWQLSGKAATALVNAQAQAGSTSARKQLNQDRVAFLAPPSRDYVRIKLGIWRAGGISVPLCVTHPPPELAYVLQDSGVSTLVATAEYADVARAAVALCERKPQIVDAASLWASDGPVDSSPAEFHPPESQRAMIIYTSGTTGKPKGVVSTFGMLRAQTSVLLQAWEWQSSDRILHALPLHHMHGLVNALLCPLRAHATVEFMPRFDALAVWQRWAQGGITVWMAVPTMYAKMLQAYETLDAAMRQRVQQACRQMRLMVSGSAALPVPILERWREITGHVLLERYGMTEIGMALSNPLHGDRRPGTVGLPLPGVEVRIVGDQGEESDTGELRVRGPSVFREYWGRPQAAAKEFDVNGWFKTGDVVSRDAAGYYVIMGRASVDIIKTGGYKVSALEIESTLLRHPAVLEAAVVGLPDPTWGERVAAAVILRPGTSAADVTTWLRGELAPYKVPRAVLVTDSLPHNAMGKVNKKAVRDMIQAAPASATGTS